MSHRATPLVSNGYSPFEIMFGVPMALNIDTSLIHEVNTSPEVDEYLERLLPKIKAIRESAMKNNALASDRAKFYYDRDAKYPKLSVGQEVLLHNSQLAKDEHRKLHRQWCGPYVIVQSFPETYTHKIREVASGKLMESHIHSNRLRPYIRRKAATTIVPPVQPAAVPSSGVVMPGGSAGAPDLSQPTPGTSASQPLPDGWYEIDRLTNQRKIGKKIYFQVKWKDGSSTWEPEDNVTEVAIKAFREARKASRRKQ